MDPEGCCEGSTLKQPMRPLELMLEHVGTCWKAVGKLFGSFNGMFSDVFSIASGTQQTAARCRRHKSSLFLC